MLHDKHKLLEQNLKITSLCNATILLILMHWNFFLVSARLKSSEMCDPISTSLSQCRWPRWPRNKNLVLQQCTWGAGVWWFHSYRPMGTHDHSQFHKKRVCFENMFAKTNVHNFLEGSVSWQWKCEIRETLPSSLNILKNYTIFSYFCTNGGPCTCKFFYKERNLCVFLKC